MLQMLIECGLNWHIIQGTTGEILIWHKDLPVIEIELVWKENCMHAVLVKTMFQVANDLKPTR